MSTPNKNQSKGRKGALGMVFLIAFLDIVGFSILFPLFPHMLEHYLQLEGEGSWLSGSLQKLASLAGDQENPQFLVNTLFGGILGSIYSILQFLFAPVWGSMSDRSGRRPTLLLTLVGTVVSYVMWFFAGSFALLVAARILGGMMAGNISTATAVVSDVTEPHERSKGMGMVGAAIGLGFIFGPAIGGLTADWNLLEVWPGGERLGVNPFSGPALCALALGLLNLFLVATRFKETRNVDEAGSSGNKSINPVKLFRSVQTPGVPRTNLIYFFFLVAFSAIEFTLTFLTLERFDFTPRDNAYMFVFVGLIIVFVQGGMIRRLAPKYGDAPLARIGILLVIPGFFLIGLASSVGQLYGGLAFMALGSAFTMPCLGGLVSRYAPEKQQGLALGLFRSMGALSRAIGPILGGVMYWQLGSKSSYFSATALLLLAAIISLGLPSLSGKTESSTGH